MALQQVNTILDGRWIESFRYLDYRVVEVYVPFSSLFQEFVDCIQGRLFPSSNISVSHFTVYWDDCNNPNHIQIVEDKDVSWLMLVLSKFPNNYLLVVVDSVSAGAVGNVSYLNTHISRFTSWHGDHWCWCIWIVAW